MIVAFDREELVGFVMITSKGKGLFKESLLSNFRDVLTFMLQASPVGCLKAAWIKIASGTTEIPTVPKLVYIAVDERFRGCGYGATLIDAAEAWFRQEGIGYYELDVHAPEPVGVEPLSRQRDADQAVLRKRSLANACLG